MANYSAALHHRHIRERIYAKHEPFPHPDRFKRTFDHVIYAVAIFAPVMNLPQLFKIWLQKDATGVSFISWASFSIFSLAWLVYGILHREKPIIFMNLLLMVIQALIATGVILYT